MALATMQKAHLDSVRSDVHGKISKKTVELLYSGKTVQ